jgi:hypothetical protein
LKLPLSTATSAIAAASWARLTMEAVMAISLAGEHVHRVKMPLLFVLVNPRRGNHGGCMDLRPTRLLLAILLLSVGAARAQQETPASQPAQAPAPNVQLSGPRVAPPAAEARLISYNLDGALRRLEIPPEEAALELIGLSESERAGADKVLSERAVAVDKVVADNLPLLLKFQGVRKNDSQKEQMQALSELRRAMEPVRQRGTLREELSKVIPPEKMAQLDLLVSDYRQAVLLEAEQTLKLRGEAPKPEAIRGREMLLAVGQELRRSYDRQIAAKTDQLNDMLKAVNATPEQEGKITNLATDFFQKTLGKPTPEQRHELFANVMKELDDDQKLLLLKEFYAGVKK